MPQQGKVGTGAEGGSKVRGDLGTRWLSEGSRIIEAASRPTLGLEARRQPTSCLSLEFSKAQLLLKELLRSESHQSKNVY